MAERRVQGVRHRAGNGSTRRRRQRRAWLSVGHDALKAPRLVVYYFTSRRYAAHRGDGFGNEPLNAMVTGRTGNEMRMPRCRVPVNPRKKSLSAFPKKQVADAGLGPFFSAKVTSDYKR